MKLRSQNGQAAVLTLVFMTALLGVAAIVIDAGSWYRDHRRLQSFADAAALAGAQALPEDPAAARRLAQDYATRNGGSLGSVTIAKGTRPNDTIAVTAKDSPPGIFSGVLGVQFATVSVKAAALAATPAAARLVAPITIGSDNPQLRCGAPCYGQPTQLVALPTGNYNGNQTNFQLVDLSKHGGAVAPSVVANWLRRGYQSNITLGAYPGVASTTFNSTDFRQALNDMKGKPIVVLVHSNAGGNEGQAGAQYTEIGWAGFVITDFSGSGAQGTLKGYFSSVNIGGIPSSDPGTLSYGVRTISLVD